MHYEYKTKGTCSRAILFDVEDGLVKNVQYIGGCNGNLKAIAKLVEGRSAAEVADTLRGNTCGPRTTSCADQLSRAISEALAK